MLLSKLLIHAASVDAMRLAWGLALLLAVITVSASAQSAATQIAAVEGRPFMQDHADENARINLSLDTSMAVWNSTKHHYFFLRG